MRSRMRGMPMFGPYETLESPTYRQRFRFDLDQLRRLMNPTIDGLEVTQGIQYYRAAEHLTDANDRGGDNTVALVANKPAWARVYVRSGILGDSRTVTGEVVVQRQRLVNLPVWDTVATLSPRAPGTATTERDPGYVLERSTLATTLNFIIPQEAMWGLVRVIARIWPQDDATATPVDSFTLVLDATLKQTLRLRGVMISYAGPDPTVNPVNPPTINLPAPTLANLQATAAWTLTTFPVASQAIFSSAGTLAWGTPLTGMATSPGGCSTQWLQLNAAVAQVRANDGNRNDVIYYGLLPAGTPIANVGGCESSGVSTGPNGVQVTMAHEVGHGAGLAHGPCGTPGDANYPAYEPYDPASTPTASLGEYGLDINNGRIHPPAEKDFMSYCGPPWISLYHHARLYNNAKLNPETVGRARWRPPILVDPYLWPWEYIPDPPPWERHPGDYRMKAERVISLIGVVDEERRVDVHSVMRVTALPFLEDARETSFVAQLVGREGSVVASAPVMRLDARGCGCCEGGRDGGSGPFVFQALLPDVEPGAELRIVGRRGAGEPPEEAWTRRAPDREVSVHGIDASLEDERLVVRWEAERSSEEPLDFSLQFSKDDGRSWNGLAVNLRETSYETDLAELPSGTILLRLLAHDGFSTASAESGPLEVPPRGPTISILHPQEGPALIAGRPMRLWAAVTTSSGEAVDPEACRWLIDDTDVATGIDAWTEAPEAGEHRCTLVVEDGGGRSETSVGFTTIDPERLTPSSTPL